MSFGYSLVQLYKNKFLTIITTAMLAISFIVIEYAAASFVQFNYSRWVSRDVITDDLERIYHINFFKYGMSGEQELLAIKDFYLWMSEQPEIRYSGKYCVYEDEKLLLVSQNISELCGIELKGSEEDKHAWVGAERADEYEVGSYYVDKLNSTCSLEIAGVLPPNSKFICSEFMSGFGYVLNLDEYIILDQDMLIDESIVNIVNGIDNNFYFCLSDSADTDEFIERLLQKANDLNLDLYGIHNLKELFHALSMQAVEQSGERYLMPLIVLICALAAMVIATLESYIKNRHDAGVMMMCGMTRRQIYSIFALENVIKSIIALAIAYFYWKRKLSEMQIIWKEIFDFINPLCFLLVVVMSFLSSLPIILKLRGKPPCVLLEKKSGK